MKIIFIDLTEEQRAMRQGNRKGTPEYPSTDKLLILEDKKQKKDFISMNKEMRFAQLPTWILETAALF